MPVELTCIGTASRNAKFVERMVAGLASLRILRRANGGARRIARPSREEENKATHDD
jgi:hypothetical protein